MAGAPGHSFSLIVGCGVIVLVGEDVALVVGVEVGGDVGVLEVAVVAVAACVFVDKGRRVCVDVASWLQATRLTIKITVNSISLILLLNMLPPLDVSIKKADIQNAIELHQIDFMHNRQFKDLEFHLPGFATSFSSR
jgi:hypothetical protein